MGCEFKSVGKTYGDKVAVDDVSFEVEPGEILGLLGPNGAGKTTLIRILMDILRPTTGQVLLFGEPLDRRQLDRVGYLPEERGLYKKLKVIDVLVYFGTLKGLSRREARRRSLEWLERVKLEEVPKWRVERLSKGMSQKVQIAATLLSEPELCVLDEPFSGLDPVNVRLIKDLIHQRRERGLTTILSTHQMNMVEELCDRVALIHSGRLMVYGEVEDVRRAHTPPLVLVRADREPPALPGVLEVSSVERPGRSLSEQGWYRMHLDRAASEDGQDLESQFGAVLSGLVAAGVSIDHFERVLASMEDIFLQVVGEDGSVARSLSELPEVASVEVST